MRTTVFSLISFFFLSQCSNFKNYERNGAFNLANYTKNISGIELPKQAKLIHEFDNGEGYAEALYTVQQEEIKELVKEHAFASVDSLPGIKQVVQNQVQRKQQLNSFGLHNCNNKNYALSNYSNLLYFNFCKNQNGLMIIADTSKGMLWLTINYPDMAGDGPECN